MSYTNPFADITYDEPATDGQAETRPQEVTPSAKEGASSNYVNPFEDVVYTAEKPGPRVTEEEYHSKLLTSPEKQETMNLMESIAAASDSPSGLKFGWQLGARNLYEWAAQIPGGIVRVSNWLAENTGYTPKDIKDGETVADAIARESKSIGLGPIEAWLKEKGKAVAPDEWLMQNQPRHVLQKIGAGFGSAPAEIAKLIPMTKAFGATGGFALSEAIGHLDQPVEVILEKGIEGAIIGRVFAGLEPIRGMGKVGAGAALGAASAAAAGGGVDDIVAGGVALGGLMAIGAGTKYKPPTNFKQPIKEVSPLENKLPTFETTSPKIRAELENKIANQLDQLTQIRAQQKTEKSPEIRDTLKIAGRDAKARLKDLYAKAHEYNVARAFEDNIKMMIKHAEDLSAKNGTDPRYELFKLNPKLAPEYRFQDLVSLAAEFRADSKNPGAIILDPLSLKNRILNTHITGTDVNGRPIKEVSRTERDLTPREVVIKGMLTPGKLMEQNTLVRWAVDTIDQMRINIESKTNELLYAPRMYKGFGLTALRVAKERPTELGGMSIFEGLSRKRQDKIRDALMKDEQAARLREADTSDLGLQTRYKLDAAEIASYRGMRTMFDRTLDYINDAITRFRPDLKPIERIPNWLPHLFTGELKVFVKDANGELVHAAGAQTVIGQKLLARQLKKDFPNLDVIVPDKTTRTFNISPSSRMFSEMMMFLGNEHPLRDAVAEVHAKALREQGFMRHGKERKWVGGFAGEKGGRSGAKEFEMAAKQFVDGAVRWGEHQKANALMEKTLTDGVVSSKYPNSMEWIHKYKNNAFGQTGEVTNLLNKIVGDYIGEHGLQRTVGGLSHITLVSQLLRVAHIMSQYFQTIQSLPPRLADLNAKGIRGNMVEATGRTLIDLILPSKGAQDAVRFAVRNKTIAPKFVEEGRAGEIHAQGSSIGSGITGRAAAKTVWDIVSLQSPTAKAEEASRLVSVLTIYNYARSAGVPHAEAVKLSSRQTNVTMVEYNNIERPLVFSEAGMGAIGKLAGLFQTFKFNWLAQALQYVKTAKDTGDVRPVATLFATTLIVAGVKGMIGAAEWNLLANTLNERAGTNLPTIEELLIESNAPDLLIYGLPSTVAGFDMSSTMNAPGVDDEHLAVPGLEYVGGTLLGGSSLMWKMAIGKDTPDDHMEFWLQASPTAYRGAVEAYYTNEKFGKITGVPVPDPKHRGRGTVHRELSDWYARFLGGRSLKESRELITFYEMTRIEKQAAKSEETLINIMAHAIASGNDYPDWVVPALAEKGVTGKALADKVKSRIMLWNTTLIERASMDKNKKQQLSRQPLLQGLESAQGD